MNNNSFFRISLRNTFPTERIITLLESYIKVTGIRRWYIEKKSGLWKPVFFNCSVECSSFWCRWNYDITLRISARWLQRSSFVWSVELLGQLNRFGTSATTRSTFWAYFGSQSCQCWSRYSRNWIDVWGRAFRTLFSLYPSIVPITTKVLRIFMPSLWRGRWELVFTVPVFHYRMQRGGSRWLISSKLGCVGFATLLCIKYNRVFLYE